MEKNNKLIIIILSVVCLCLCGVIGYLVISANNEKCNLPETGQVETENKVDKETNEDVNSEVTEEGDGTNLDEEVDEEYDEEYEYLISFDDVKKYTSKDVSKITLTIPCDNCSDPEVNIITICKEEDIEYILDTLDDMIYVGKLPEGIGLTTAFAIEITNNDYESISIVFAGEESLWINGAEYKLTRKDLAEELENKYLK